MNPEDLKKTYSNASTEQLLNIIDNKLGYTDMAVKIALEELAKREISESDIKTYKENVEAELLQSTKKLLLNDLRLAQKNFFFFLWIPLIHFALKQNFREDGYYLKLKQATYYSWCGVGALMLSVFISIEFDLSELSTLGVWIAGFIPAYAFDEKFNRAAIIARMRERRDRIKSDSNDSNND